MPKTTGKELMQPGADLRGVSPEDASRAILTYLDRVGWERARGIHSMETDPPEAVVVTSFLHRWLELNQTEESERLKAIIDKHFGTEFLKK